MLATPTICRIKLCAAAMFCCALLAWPSQNFAVDLFVNNLAGDDRFDGRATASVGNYQGPVRTITRALHLADSGDRIVIANTGEPYRETVSLVGLRHSGNASWPFVIEGNGAVLDGSTIVPYEYWEQYRPSVFRCRPRRLGYQQLFINGTPGVQVPSDDSTRLVPRLEPLQWCLHRGYLYVRLEPDGLLSEYRLAVAALQTGITLYKVRDVRIANLVVQGFQIDGVHADDSSYDVFLGRVVSQANGRAGFAVTGASRVRFIECLARENRVAQLFLSDPAQVRLDSTQLIPGPGAPVVDKGGVLEIGDTTASPRPPSPRPLLRSGARERGRGGGGMRDGLRHLQTIETVKRSNGFSRL